MYVGQNSQCTLPCLEFATTIPEDVFTMEDDMNCVRTDSYAISILIALIAAVGLLANSVVIFIITVLRSVTRTHSVRTH